MKESSCQRRQQEDGGRSSQWRGRGGATRGGSGDGRGASANTRSCTYANTCNTNSSCGSWRSTWRHSNATTAPAIDSWYTGNSWLSAGVRWQCGGSEAATAVGSCSK